MTSFNRNFKARNDGNLKTMNFLASPEIVTAMAFSGDLNFNPVTDSIPTPNGPFKFSPPSGDRLPLQVTPPATFLTLPAPLLSLNLQPKLPSLLLLLVSKS